MERCEIMAKILAVDDSNMIKKIVVSSLVKAGYEVMDASNGMNALDIIARNKIELLVTDLNMPKMDGIQLIRELRKNSAYKRLPIIMLTTNPSEEAKALAAGANVYLKKPVSSEKLISVIDKLLK